MSNLALLSRVNGQRKWQFIIFAFSLLVWCQPLLCADGVDDQLKHLSSSEKIHLKDFFAMVVREDHLGHVLFFPNKPACLTGIQIRRNMPIRDKAFLNGWKAWKKNEHLFPHPNFIFCSEVAKFKNLDEYLHVYIINKKTLIARLIEFEDFFKEILGEDFSKEAFIENLEKTKHLSALINNDDALRGLLLGFDKESAIAFKQVSTRRFKGDLAEQYQRINCEAGGKHIIHPVVFMGNPDAQEASMLMQAYAHELDPIQDLYQKKDLLKLVLEALSTP